MMEPVTRITALKEAVPASDGSDVFIKANAVLGGQCSELEIAIATELAAELAITLLATTAKARAARDGFEPALDVLAAAVVESGCAERVRLQLLFENCTVLPLEVAVEAAMALNRGLTEELHAPVGLAASSAVTQRSADSSSGPCEH